MFTHLISVRLTGQMDLMWAIKVKNIRSISVKSASHSDFIVEPFIDWLSTLRRIAHSGGLLHLLQLRPKRSFSHSVIGSYLLRRTLNFLVAHHHRPDRYDRINCLVIQLRWSILKRLITRLTSLSQTCLARLSTHTEWTSINHYDHHLYHFSIKRRLLFCMNGSLLLKPRKSDNLFVSVLFSFSFSCLIFIEKDTKKFF